MVGWSLVKLWTFGDYAMVTRLDMSKWSRLMPDILEVVFEGFNWNAWRCHVHILLALIAEAKHSKKCGYCREKTNKHTKTTCSLNLKYIAKLARIDVDEQATRIDANEQATRIDAAEQATNVS
ncbi:hypothetical protein Tco_0927538 [Tanacetum coccineum]